MKEINTQFKERYKFIEKQKDTKIYGSYCSKHNLHFNGQCPECFKEESLERHGKEIKEKGIWIGRQAKCDLELKYEKDKKKNTLYKIERYKRDEVFKEYMKNACKKTREKNKIRKLSHSL